MYNHAVWKWGFFNTIILRYKSFSLSLIYSGLISSMLVIFRNVIKKYTNTNFESIFLLKSHSLGPWWSYSVFFISKSSFPKIWLFANFKYFWGIVGWRDVLCSRYTISFRDLPTPPRYHNNIIWATTYPMSVISIYLHLPLIGEWI